MPRRARGETRQLIIDTGVRLLLERGLRGGCDHVGMAEVLAEVQSSTGQRVTNASVYGRIWATQYEFHRDLLLAAAGFFPSGEERATQAAADQILATSDLHSAQGRRTALSLFCRVGGAAHLNTMASSRAWQTWLAIWAITVSTPTLDDDIERGPAIAKRHELAVLEFSRVLAALLPRVGCRMRPPFTLEQLSMAIYALSEGLVLHHRFAPQTVVSVELPTGAGEAPETWTLFSVALQALLDGFTELD